MSTAWDVVSQPRGVRMGGAAGPILALLHGAVVVAEDHDVAPLELRDAGVEDQGRLVGHVLRGQHGVACISLHQGAGHACGSWAGLSLPAYSPGFSFAARGAVTFTVTTNSLTSSVALRMVGSGPPGKTYTTRSLDCPGLTAR